MKHKKHNYRQDILFVLISSFVVVVAWISFNIYHIWATSTIEENVQAHLTPIDPSFNLQVIQDLKARKQVQPVFQKDKTASSPAAIAEVTPEISPIPSPSAAVSSGSGQIQLMLPTITSGVINATDGAVVDGR